jgi:hypothetical protein
MIRLDEPRASILGLCQPTVLHAFDNYDDDSGTQDVSPGELSDMGSSVGAPLNMGSGAPIVCNTASFTLKDAESGDLMEGSTPSAVPMPGAAHTPREFPTDRRPVKRQLSGVPQALINEWFAKSGVRLGPLTPDQRDKVTRLLYTYQDLNSVDLEDLPATDLYVHRVRLKPGTPPFSRPKQRRWPPGKEF